MNIYLLEPKPHLLHTDQVNDVLSRDVFMWD